MKTLEKHTLIGDEENEGFSDPEVSVVNTILTHGGFILPSGVSWS